MIISKGTQGVSLYFYTQELPCFTLWKNTTSIADGYATGLEPAVNFPNPRTYEGQQDRVVKLTPGGQITFELRLEIHTNAAEVEQAETTIAALQAVTKPKIYDTPQPGWCAP